MTQSAPVRIHLATIADVEAIAAVLLGAFRDFEPLYTSGGFGATTPPAEEIAARFHEGPVWVARDGEAVVGTVAAVDRGEETYVRSMAVLPRMRGRGVAARLLTAAEAFGRDRGARRLTLSTAPFLAAAIALYERAGFRRLPEPVDLHGTPLIGMVKELEPREEPG